jgi:hypothetical protein
MSNYLNNFDGVQSRTIFCFWTGAEEMSANRIQALWSIFNQTGCSVALINKINLEAWIKPGYPLHPAYEFLSSTHKSDYLRCYFMHHYGGGYTDIKKTKVNWHSFFECLDKSHKCALGYSELAHGMPHLVGLLGDEIRAVHSQLIGLCAFIFKKNSPLTYCWLEKTHNLLDEKLDILKKNPAQHPLDQTAVILPDGEISKYPLRWAEMLGEIFHPLIYQNKQLLILDNIAPDFSGYR